MLRSSTLAIFASLSFVLSANAQTPSLRFEFATNDPTPVFTNSFSVAPGGRVGIRIYVRDTSAGAAILNSDFGLSSAAVRITTADPMTGIAAVTQASDIIANTEFNLGAANPQFSPTGASLTVGDFRTSGPGVLPDANGRILLATFFLTGQSQGVLNLGAEDINPNVSSNTTSFNGIGFDNFFVPGPFIATLIVAPVPEPATVLGLSALALGGLRVARRRLART